MRKPASIILVLIYTLIVQPLYVAHIVNAQVSSEVILAPNSEIYGNSYGEWTAKWWQWFLSMPDKGHPIHDLTGEKCGANQSGPVWFLVGSWERSTPVERDCDIPEGKHILLPIVNTECSVAEPGMENYKTDDQLRQCAVEGNKGVASLKATLDNKELPNLWESRIQSPVFNATYPNGAVYNATKGTFRDVSDGYWVFLKPLAKGEHDIHFEMLQPSSNPGDTEDIGSTTADVTYHLNVR